MRTREYHQAGKPRVLPIAQSTTYRYDESEQVADLFDLRKEGHMYTRISNPTVAAFEEKISALKEALEQLQLLPVKQLRRLLFLISVIQEIIS